MKRVVVLFSVALLAMSLGYGCGKKEAEEPGKVPIEVKQAETMDSTRMDSAAVDTVDTIETDTAEEHTE